MAGAKRARGVGGGRKARNGTGKGAASLTLSLPNPPPLFPSSHFDTCYAGYVDTLTVVNKKYRKKRLKQTKPSVRLIKGVLLTQGSTVFELFLLSPAPVLHLWERYSLSTYGWGPHGGVQEGQQSTWRRLQGDNRSRLGENRSPWERDVEKPLGTGNREFGKREQSRKLKMKLLIGQGLGLGFVPIFHFPVPRSTL